MTNMIAPTPPRYALHGKLTGRISLTARVITVKILGCRNGITKVSSKSGVKTKEGFMYAALAQGLPGSTVHVDPKFIVSNQEGEDYKRMSGLFYKTI